MANPWSKEEYIYDVGAMEKLYDCYSKCFSHKSETLKQYYNGIQVNFVKPLAACTLIGDITPVELKVHELKRNKKQQKNISRYSLAVSQESVNNRILIYSKITKMLESILIVLKNAPTLIKNRSGQFLITIKRSLQECLISLFKNICTFLECNILK